MQEMEKRALNEAEGVEKAAKGFLKDLDDIIKKLEEALKSLRDQEASYQKYIEEHKLLGEYEKFQKSTVMQDRGSCFTNQTGMKDVDKPDKETRDESKEENIPKITDERKEEKRFRNKKEARV